jgi:ZIP family zinc transporter
MSSGPLAALLWGLLGGSALLVGTAIAYFVEIPYRLVAAVMAFGSGVLISALSVDLMDDAYAKGGFASVTIGFLGGALAYSIANVVVTRRGGQNRKRSRQPQQTVAQGTGIAIAIGAVLDGIPESVAIGASMVQGLGVSLVTVAAVFLSNVPEALSSAAGMRKAGRSPGFVFGVWGGIALLAGAGALVGNLVLASADPATVGMVLAVAAGAILAMIVDTMIPEAFEMAHEFAGIVTAIGFLLAFALSKLTG